MVQKKVTSSISSVRSLIRSFSIALINVLTLYGLEFNNLFAAESEKALCKIYGLTRGSENMLHI